jgi:hypothetical protein
MAEAFGIASGALTAIEASLKVISKCKHLIETTRDAPKDLRHIFIEITSLKATLESLAFLSGADSDFSQAISDLNGMDGAVTGCRTTMNQLATELDKVKISTAGDNSISGATRKRQKVKDSVRWLLKESSALKLIEQASVHKSTISVALLGELTRDVHQIKNQLSGKPQIPAL